MSYLIVYQTKKNSTVFPVKFSFNCENDNRLKGRVNLKKYV